MDRLVLVKENEVLLQFKPSSPSSASITITNLMHTISVACHVTITRPHLFRLNPDTPILLPPLSSATLTITLSSLPHPPIILPPDLLAVKSILFPIGKYDKKALGRLFSSHHTPYVFKDASIPVRLVGAHVLDTCLLLQNEKLDISKSLAFCSEVELSSLLRRSASAGNPTFVAALITAGADVNKRGSDGRSALSLAVSSGCVAAVGILVENGAKIDLGTDRVFHEAAGADRVDMIQVLEKAGGVGLVQNWAGSVDNEKKNPVHYAAANGCLDAIRVCLENGGGDVDQVDSNGWTPLHCAAAGGFLNVVETLMGRSKFDPKIGRTTDDGKTPLDLAIENGHSYMYDILGLGDRFMRAAIVGDLECVKDCILKGVRVNQKDQSGWTALHRSAFRGWIEIVKVLIDNGAWLNEVDDVGLTPLQRAIEGKQVDTAILLVEYGAKKNLKGVKNVDLFSIKMNRQHVDAGSLRAIGCDYQTFDR